MPVTDGDAVAPNLTITADAASVTEGTSVGFTITADSAPSSSITVQVSVTGTGEHLAGTTPTEVTLPSGSTTAWVVLQTKDDGADASSGSVTVTIEPGAGYDVGSPSSASVTVTDGDALAPNLTITADAASVTEGTSVGFTITADSAPSSSITVQVSVTGTGEHLAGTTPTEVTLSSGSTTAWVVLQTKDDGADVSNGSVTVTIVPGAGYDVGSPSSASVPVTRRRRRCPEPDDNGRRRVGDGGDERRVHHHGGQRPVVEHHGAGERHRDRRAPCGDDTDGGDPTERVDDGVGGPADEGRRRGCVEWQRHGDD